MKGFVALFLFCFAAVAQHGKEAEKHAAAEQHGSAQSQPDLTNWKWANFALLAGALGFLIAKNAGPFFASRSQEIRKGIDEAKQLRADAEARAAAIDARLANLGVEIESIKRAASAEAEAESERVLRQTERDIAKVRAHAEQEITAALKAAQADLRRHSAQLALELAQQKVRARITPADQDSLVKSFVSGIKTAG